MCVCGGGGGGGREGGIGWRISFHIKCHLTCMLKSHSLYRNKILFQVEPDSKPGIRASVATRNCHSLLL